MTEEKKVSRRARPPEQSAMIRMERELENLPYDAQVRVVAYLQSKVTAGRVAVPSHGPAPDTRQLPLPNTLPGNSAMTNGLLRPPPNLDDL